MQYNNFEVKTLDLLSIDRVPEDCSVIIMAEPTKDITTGESNLIGAYLRGGGSLLVLAGFGNAEFPILNQLLAEFNLAISNDRIREGDDRYRHNNDAYQIRAIAPAGMISSSTVDGFTLVENARAMNILSNVKSWVTTEPVLTTSDSGISEIRGDVNQSSGAAKQTIAVLSENKGWYDSQSITQSAKVILIGSSSMLSDTILQAYGNNIYNFGLFYYAVQWLSNAEGEGDLIIEAKQPVSYYLTKGTPSAYNFSAALAFIVIPLGLLAVALVVYRRRKHL